MSAKNSSTIKFDKNSELRRARRVKLFFVFILLILLIIGGIIGFLRKKDFQIAQVSVIGTKSLSKQQILDATHEYLDGAYAVIIPKTNTLLLSKESLSQYLLNKIPSISNVTVSFIEKNSIQISIQEKKPSYIWCNESCYFVDENGIVYEESPKYTPGVFLTFSGGMIEGDPIKKTFVDQDLFKKTLNLINQLEDLEIKTLSINYGEDISLQISSIRKVSVGSQTKIILGTNESIVDAIKALTLLLNDKTFGGSIISRGQLLQYIDIRFPDKIYYKFDTPVTQVAQPTPANAKLLEKTQ